MTYSPVEPATRFFDNYANVIQVKDSVIMQITDTGTIETSVQVVMLYFCKLIAYRFFL